MASNCDICTEFYPLTEASCIPCGHTFHHSCLRRWLRRSNSCPRCREKCTLNDVIKLFFNKEVINPDDNDFSLLMVKLSEKDDEISSLKRISDGRIKLFAASEEMITNLKRKHDRCHSEKEVLQYRFSQMNKLHDKGKSENLKLTNDNDLLKSEIRDLKIEKRRLNMKVINLEKKIEELTAEPPAKPPAIDAEMLSNLFVLTGVDTAVPSKRTTDNTENISPVSESLLNVHQSPDVCTKTPEVNKVFAPPLKRARLEPLHYTRMYKIYIPKSEKVVCLDGDKMETGGNSIIRNGYNGLGGHSKFVRGTPSADTAVMKTLKNTGKK